MKTSKYILVMCKSMYWIVLIYVLIANVYAQSSKVNIFYEYGRPIIKIKVFNNDYKLLVDTGGNGFFIKIKPNLLLNLLKEAKHNTLHYKINKSMDFSGNVYSSKSYNIKLMLIDGYKINSVSVGEFIDHDENIDRNIDGILGLGFFMKIPTIIDFKNNTFNTFPTEHEINSMINSNNNVSVQIPIRINEYGILLPIKFCKTCRELDVVLDTGSSFTFVNKTNGDAYLKRAFKKEDYGVYTMQNIFIHDLNIADFGIHQKDRVYIEKDTILPGLLGMSSMRDKILFIDFEHNRLVIAN